MKVESHCILHFVFIMLYLYNCIKVGFVHSAMMHELFFQKLVCGKTYCFCSNNLSFSRFYPCAVLLHQKIHFFIYDIVYTLFWQTLFHRTIFYVRIISHKTLFTCYANALATIQNATNVLIQIARYKHVYTQSVAFDIDQSFPGIPYESYLHFLI